MLISRRIIGAGAAAVVAVSAFTGMTGSAAADSRQTPNNSTVTQPTGDSGATQRSSCPSGHSTWHCFGGYAVIDGGPNYVYAVARKNNGDSVAASFQPSGEYLKVHDHFNNDHWTMAEIWVEGFGTERRYSHGRQTVEWQLDYPENRKMWLRVCTSKYGGAVCTKPYHRST
ncbi:hypothetical protein [Actinomadura madurae]|uniref:Secreted protein n=1 Tax=Actinomadura madurae TaxID=1993 RepID=A0A1I5YYL1_9ACTN|nr:hypothetical protein [Actinomadura madurae]SFQ48947.1 hypothetical protein SAMN04489713_1414 [Actinomadura madurae]SPT51858.1 Uncharacterised protein [Actinomadura madurae]